MFVDAQLQFSAAQALTVTAASTNVIDTGVNFAGTEVDRNVGIGEPMNVLICVIVAADVADGNETYQFDLQTDTVVGFGSAVVLVSRIIARALLTAGSIWSIPVPADWPQIKRYLRMNYTLGGTTPTITVSAFLQPMSMMQNFVVYQDALTIS